MSDRPVNARAARMANIVASVPELVNRRRSIDGTPAADLLGQLDLGLGRCREGGPAADLGLDRGDDGGVGVAQDQRGVIAQEVAVAVAIDVLDATARNPTRHTADRAP